MAKLKYFVFGDIHGYLNKLENVFELIQPMVSAEDVMVFLGDYIDRGPESKGVIEYLIQLSRKRGNCIFLKGNHEDMFLDFMGLGGNHGESYLLNGAKDTFYSYGGKNNIPKDHINFIFNSKPYHLCEDYPYIFVHAGLKPGKLLKEQDPLDLYWIRRPFIDYEGSWEDSRKVIYGHTPAINGFPKLELNKIGIDTGAAYGGPLSVLMLPEERIFQSSPV
jgi:serine/threonine protein phosphatase 1